jgi:hypothetical protein
VAFLLGSLAEAAGEHPAAFEWFERGNGLQSGEFDIAAHERWIDRLVAAAGSTPRGRSGSRGPVFVVGMPRSGTTLVERMLAAHPALFGAGELGRIGELSVAMEQRGWRYPESLDALPGAALAGWARDYLARVERQGARGRIPVDKMWQNFEHLGLIRRLFPDARIVHCRRHPLDVGLSCLANHFSSAGAFAFSRTLPGVAAYYRGYERLVAAWRARLDPPMLELRYESLIADPRRALRELLDFLGLPFEPRCLEFHREPGVVLTASYAQVRRPLYASSVGRWRRFRAQLAPLAAALRDLVTDSEIGSRDPSP